MRGISLREKGAAKESYRARIYVVVVVVLVVLHVVVHAVVVGVTYCPQRG